MYVGHNIFLSKVLLGLYVFFFFYLFTYKKEKRKRTEASYLWEAVPKILIFLYFSHDANKEWSSSLEYCSRKNLISRATLPESCSGRDRIEPVIVCAATAPRNFYMYV